MQAALAELKQDYERPGGLQLVEVAGGYQIVTRPDLHEWVRRLFHERTTQKLTVQALETLAVIAYQQPITALEITEIRGVNTSGVLNTLLERHLIKIVGRKQVVGRPFLYATTKEFLIRFGLNDLSDLPKVEDMAEALGFEAPLLVEQTPSEEMLPLEEPEDDRAAARMTPGGSVAPMHVASSQLSPLSLWLSFVARAGSVICAAAFFRRVDLVRRQLPPVPGLQPRIADRSDRDALQVRRPDGRSRRTSSAPGGCAPRGS